MYGTHESHYGTWLDKVLQKLYPESHASGELSHHGGYDPTEWDYDHKSVWNERDHPIVKLSRFLSLVLRHSGSNNNFSHDDAAFFKTEEIFRSVGRNHDFRDANMFSYVVATNPKQRFETKLTRASGEEQPFVPHEDSPSI